MYVAKNITILSNDIRKKSLKIVTNLFRKMVSLMSKK